MKRLRQIILTTAGMIALLAIVAALIPTSPLIGIPARAEFSKRVSIAGGSPAPRLSDSLATAGYSAGDQLDELTIKNLPTNANSFYIGSSSSVNASTGFELAPGVAITYRAGARPINGGKFFLFTATTQNSEITLRER